MSQLYCVYGHYTPHGELFYVGCGRYPERVRSTDRNRLWHAKVEEIEDFYAHVFVVSQDREYLEITEEQLIKKYQPSCNVVGTEREKYHHAWTINPKGKKAKKPITFMVDEETLADLDFLAERNYQNRAQVLRGLIKRSVERIRRKESA